MPRAAPSRPGNQPDASTAFYRGVLASMTRLAPVYGNAGRSTVRFGPPNDGLPKIYQIETSDGIHALRGADHLPDPAAIGGRYWDSDLVADEFSLQDVQRLLRACPGGQ
jgi:hypothetical protein